MRVVVLCGGSGTRLEDYSLPKPLNMIYGKPSISYALSSIPVDSLHFIVAPHLRKYNFEQIIIITSVMLAKSFESPSTL